MAVPWTLLHTFRCVVPAEEQGCSGASTGDMPADVPLGGHWSSRAGWAGGPCSAGWPRGGRHEAWDRQRTVVKAISSAQSRAALDVFQPRGCACTTVALRAVRGCAVEEFVLTFSVSISAFGHASVPRPWLGPAGRARSRRGSPGPQAVSAPSPAPSPCHLRVLCLLVFSLLGRVRLELRSPCL